MTSYTMGTIEDFIDRRIFGNVRDPRFNQVWESFSNLYQTACFADIPQTSGGEVGNTTLYLKGSDLAIPSLAAIGPFYPETVVELQLQASAGSKPPYDDVARLSFVSLFTGLREPYLVANQRQTPRLLISDRVEQSIIQQPAPFEPVLVLDELTEVVAGLRGKFASYNKKAKEHLPLPMQRLTQTLADRMEGMSSRGQDYLFMLHRDKPQEDPYLIARFHTPDYIDSDDDWKDTHTFDDLLLNWKHQGRHIFGKVLCEPHDLMWIDQFRDRYDVALARLRQNGRLDRIGHFLEMSVSQVGEEAEADSINKELQTFFADFTLFRADPSQYSSDYLILASSMDLAIP